MRFKIVMFCSFIFVYCTAFLIILCELGYASKSVCWVRGITSSCLAQWQWEMSSTRRILPSFYCLQAHRHSSPVPHHDLPLTHSCKLSASPYAIVQATEVALNSIHQWTHLPWWAVIVGTTLALRTVITLPLAVYQMKMGAKQELLLPRLKELQEATLHNVVIKCRRANLPHTEANRIFQKEVIALHDRWCIWSGAHK